MHKSGASDRSLLAWAFFPDCTTEFLVCLVHVDGRGRTYKEQHPSPGNLSSLCTRLEMCGLFFSSASIRVNLLHQLWGAQASNGVIKLRSLDHPGEQNLISSHSRWSEIVHRSSKSGIGQYALRAWKDKSESFSFRVTACMFPAKLS